jgi:hypothetical protein
MPYQFTFADCQTEIAFYWYDGTTFTFINTIGSNGYVKIPIENSEITLNAYVPPMPGGNDYQLAYTLFNGRNSQIAGGTNFPGIYPQVSMVNAPDDLNGQILPVVMGARIQHALPLT